MSATTRVFLADDHPVVRQGLRLILASEPSIVVVGEAGSAEEALQRLSTVAADILLLDIALPGRSGLEALSTIRQQHPNMPVLILSQYPEDQMAVRSIRAGAAGYLNKDAAPDELVQAILRLRTGRKYLTPNLAELLAETLQLPNEPPHQLLSSREYQVFCMLASGKSVSEIGELLHLSVKTVSTYRTRILEKMGMQNNADMTRYAFQNQLID